jgi:hypothetical protein
MNEDTKKIVRQWKENFLSMSNELNEARKIIKEWENKTRRIQPTTEKTFCG